MPLCLVALRAFSAGETSPGNVVALLFAPPAPPSGHRSGHLRRIGCVLGGRPFGAGVEAMQPHRGHATRRLRPGVLDVAYRLGGESNGPAEVLQRPSELFEV